MKFREIRIIERDNKRLCSVNFKYNRLIKSLLKNCMKKEVREREFKETLIKCNETITKFIAKLNMKQKKK